MASTFNLSKPNRPIHVGVLLMASVTELLDIAPVDMLHALTPEIVSIIPYLDPALKDQTIDMEIHWISETGGPARLTGGLTVQPTDTFATVPPVDIIIMGANEMTYTPTEAEMAYVRKAYEQSSAFISICGGVQVPMQAGLLSGKTVTGPRPMLASAKDLVPDATWVEKRWVQDEKLWTSGTLLNGLDLMRAFVTQTWGGEGTLVDYILELGHWPIRDVDYKDAPSKV